MKHSIQVLLAALLLCGCATSTIQSRKQERYGAYSALSPEWRALLDQGQIKVGMNMDAVYIAWGKPSEILAGETAKGTTTTWLYRGTQVQEVQYWGYYPYYARRCYYSGPYLMHDYYPLSYVKAEVVFEANVVREWRSLPQPY